MSSSKTTLDGKSLKSDDFEITPSLTSSTLNVYSSSATNPQPASSPRYTSAELLATATSSSLGKDKSTSRKNNSHSSQTDIYSKVASSTVNKDKLSTRETETLRAMGHSFAKTDESIDDIDESDSSKMAAWQMVSADSDGDFRTSSLGSLSIGDDDDRLDNYVNVSFFFQISDFRILLEIMIFSYCIDQKFSFNAVLLY